jgi:hypothetical protein
MVIDMFQTNVCVLIPQPTLLGFGVPVIIILLIANCHFTYVHLNLLSS